LAGAACQSSVATVGKTFVTSFHLPLLFFCEKVHVDSVEVTTVTAENENTALAFADAGCPREQRTKVMQHALPSNPNLDHMRREARYLLHGLLTRESSALRRFYSIDPSAGASQPNLADAQYVIAREHGFSSWRKMEAQIKQPSGTFQISWDNSR